MSPDDLIADSHQEEWLSVAAVALKLSVSQKQIRKWVAAGQFDEIAVFSPRVMRISLAAYRRFVQKYKAA